MLILRQGTPPNFSYVDTSNNKITNSNTLKYVKGLAIPPKYIDVKIYISIKKGIPQEPLKQTYTGVDDKGRTQYGYSKAWKEKSKKSKYKDLVSFGKALPKIRSSISATLKKGISSTPTLEMNIAIIIRIIMSCHFRLGNLKYKNMYKSYGITNIEVCHIKFNASSAKISFIGKKGVKNDCIVKEKQMLSHLQTLIKGKHSKDPVFTYNNGVDCTERVRANDINEWMKKFGTDITSKMFRTFATNVMFIELMKEIDDPESQSIAQRKRSINNVIDNVSNSIHNTRAVCKKEYTHPDLIKMYLEHPRTFKRKFMGDIDPEPSFLSYLRSK
jgi:DNA topoisomerase-1